MSNAERRPATQDDLFTLKSHQLQVLNLIRENELTIAELRVATGTKYPNRRVCEIEALGFEIIRGSFYAGEGLVLNTYRYTGNVIVPTAAPAEATCSA